MFNYYFICVTFALMSYVFKTIHIFLNKMFRMLVWLADLSTRSMSLRDETRDEDKEENKVEKNEANKEEINKANEGESNESTKAENKEELNKKESSRVVDD